MFYKKTLILSSVTGGNEKAVVNIEYDSGELIGTLKLYNFKQEPNGILSLGILENDKVIKSGLSKIQDMKYSFKISPTKNLEKFSCGLINIDKGEVIPLLHGATDGASNSESVLAKVASEVELDKMNVKQIEKILDDNNIELDDAQEIEEQINECLDDKNCSCGGDKCGNCEYRKAFYCADKVVKNEDSYFSGVQNQIEGLFDKYPAEDFLPSIIPNSKWVKIDNEDNEEYYVLGLVYEEERVKYICYGVPGMFKDLPPKDLKDVCQWLPLDSLKPEDFGYWITYQDADSGETIKAIFDIA